MRRRLPALLVLLGAILGIGLALAGGASAHATVVGSDPVDGSRLTSVPGVVTITFDESVGLGGAGYLHVIDEGGQRVDSGSAFHPGGNGAKIADKLKSGLGDGTYTGSYRVLSADSHPIAGTVRFVVGNGGLRAAAVDSSTVNPRTSVMFDIARWTSFAGFALLGGAWLLLSVWPQGREDRRARAIVWTGWGVTALGAIAELLLQGPYAAGTGPSDLAKWSLLDQIPVANEVLNSFVGGLLHQLLWLDLELVADARRGANSHGETAMAGRLLRQGFLVDHWLLLRCVFIR